MASRSLLAALGPISIATSGLRYALTYVLLGIGEAANRLPAEFHSRHPSVAWSNIIGMRHRLVHGYDSVDLDRVWLVVTAELRPLIA